MQATDRELAMNPADLNAPVSPMNTERSKCQSNQSGSEFVFASTERMQLPLLPLLESARVDADHDVLGGDGMPWNGREDQSPWKQCLKTAYKLVWPGRC